MPQDWDRLSEEFARLRDIPMPARDAYLTELAPPLASALRPLLHADEAAREDPEADFLESSLSRTIHTAANDPAPGETDFAAYEILGLIGRGGMGSVYLAERSDGAFEHKVAIKVLSGEFPDRASVRRFELERQILADLRHPNIARFLDGGSLADGRPFLVMEYVEGVAIDTFCEQEDLDPRGRVRLMLKACAAVSAAHDHLVVHRDIKPANLLVDAEGEPHLVDFGIAKPLAASPRAAATQTTLFHRRLTPLFASPEQLLGEPVTVSSDVYSLGVTLYLLVTGRAPRDFSALTPRDSLVELLERQPTAPSKRRQARPGPWADRLFLADLDRVILKAIESRVSDRYSSVRDLAEDLERALSGGPVLAGRPSPWRRARTWCRRHPVTMAVAGVCVTWALVSLILFEVQRVRLRTEASQAQEFMQRANEIQATSRVIAYLPRQTLSQDPRAKLAEESAAIRRELPETTGLGNHAAQYALGRSLLALGQLEEARFALQTAWDSGLRYPSVAAALGEVYGRLYGKHLDEIRRLERSETETAGRERLARELREPALSYLRLASEPGADLWLYLTGLIAFFEDRLDDAERLAGEAFEQAPWLFEAKILDADVQRRRAETARQDGRLEQSLEILAGARASYRRISELTPGAIQAIYGKCETWLLEVDVLFSKQLLAADTISRAEAACASSADADALRGRLQQATLALYLGWNLRHTGSAAGAHDFENAARWAREVLAVEPRHPVALRTLGDALVQLAIAAPPDGLDPEGLFAEAEQALVTAREVQPRSLPVQVGHGTAALAKAVWQRNTGRDSRPSFRLAIERLGETARSFPDSAGAATNLGTAAIGLAYTSSGVEAAEALALAIRELTRAHEIDPHDLTLTNNLGNLWTFRANLAYFTGSDMTPHLDRAKQLFEQTMAENPADTWALINLGFLYEVRARGELAEDRSPSQDLRRARDFARRAAATGFDILRVPILQSHVEWLTARVKVNRGQDPHKELAAIAAHLARAEALGGGGSSEVALIRAEAEWLRARRFGTGSEAWRGAIRSAAHHLAEARRAMPPLAGAWALEGQLRAALCLVDQTGDCRALEEDWFRKAESIQPGIRRDAWRWR